MIYKFLVSHNYNKIKVHYLKRIGFNSKTKLRNFKIKVLDSNNLHLIIQSNKTNY